MKIFIGSIILLSCISNLNAQVFKLENGLAFSKLQTKGVKGANIDLYPHKLTTYQISLDIEYLQTKHFYLSSSICYLEKGGKYTDIVNQSMSERHINQYITINTLTCLKANIRHEIYYLGIGPRIDIRTNHKVSPPDIPSYTNQWPSPNSLVYGLKCEVGFKLQLKNNWEFGVNTAYLPSFNSTHSSSYNLKLRDQTFTLTFMIGYNICK